MVLPGSPLVVQSTREAFMVLSNGNANCWGDEFSGGNCSGISFAGVTDVYSTRYAFMALNKNTGEAQCWGDEFSGGKCSGVDFAGITDVYSTGSAFMALNEHDDGARCWGYTASE